MTGVRTELRMVHLPRLGHCVRIHQGSGRTVHLPVDAAYAVIDAVADGLDNLEKRGSG
ncbi:hypothetical protein [Rhodococcus sp. JS3073]|uniref:hypothetical protein n=1 Tax=Rhodococcus sp. JS3073 TaxID=3002901 RepID=UPI0022854C86|nr:hypothetical protein [Rhodococcus sp. JS3073]WAM13938.1 hypothetical protein OYT95_31630 [Rhodococcus sp. JS3073]